VRKSVACTADRRCHHETRKSRARPFQSLRHLARAYIIFRHGSDPLLSQFYAIQWKIIPNLAIHLIVPPLAYLGGIYLAGKLFVLTCVVLLVPCARTISSLSAIATGHRTRRRTVWNCSTTGEAFNCFVSAYPWARNA
jgi:hypothetical protein